MTPDDTTGASEQTPTGDSSHRIPEPSRHAALSRLSEFTPRAGRDYAAERNFDFGPADRGNVSMLSPYLRHRLIAEQEVLDEVLAQHTREAAGKFIQEVFWRSYFKGWLEQHPTVWTDYRQAVTRLAGQLEADSALRKRYESAIEGGTGIDCFDAWAGELTSTGYLHNHARMWFASIWTFTLKLPWQLGADFFYRHLLDGDPASNTLGWRWISGLHTRGKTYLARASNIARYTDNRFEPANQLASSASPIDEETTHTLRALPNREQLEPGRRFGWLITEEDCRPESWALPGAPQAIIAASAVDLKSPLATGSPARAFTLGALADACERAEVHFGTPGAMLQRGDWAAGLLDWASRNRLELVATAYAPVGPVAERLADVQMALRDSGVQLVQLRSDYDELVWPHATKGYFKLKSKIPGFVSSLIDTA